MVDAVRAKSIDNQIDVWTINWAAAMSVCLLSHDASDGHEKDSECCGVALDLKVTTFCNVNVLAKICV